MIRHTGNLIKLRKNMAEESKQKTRFNGKALNVVSELFQLVIIVGLVAIAVLSFGSRIPALSNMGFRFFSVISGSMEPTIPTGAVIMVDSVDADQLKVDDIITYQKQNQETGEQSIVTHRIQSINNYQRVQEIKDDASGETSTQTVEVFELTTKGDANQEADSYVVYPGEVLGVYQWHVPKLGFLVNFIQSAKGFIAVVVIPALVLIVWESVSLTLSVREWLEKRKQNRQSQKDQRSAE